VIAARGNSKQEPNNPVRTILLIGLKGVRDMFIRL
jgi:hypothetical protein